MKPFGPILLTLLFTSCISLAYSSTTSGDNEHVSSVDEQCLAADWLHDRVRVCFTCDRRTSNWPEDNAFVILAIGSCRTPVHTRSLRWDRNAANDIIDRACVISEPVRSSFDPSEHRESIYLCSNDAEKSLQLPSSTTTAGRSGLEEINKLLNKAVTIDGENSTPESCSSEEADSHAEHNKTLSIAPEGVSRRVSGRLLETETRNIRRRSVDDEDNEVDNESSDIEPAVVTGLRVEEADKEVTYDEDGVPVVLAGTLVKARIFGSELSENSQFRFVIGALDRGSNCDNLPFAISARVDRDSLSKYSAIVSFRLPNLEQMDDGGDEPAFYLCSLGRHNGYNRWIHQGKEPGVALRTYARAVPLWLAFVLISVLLSLSGLFSGLNLGLMALDRTELKIYENTGTEKEKRYAKAISPVRNHGNYLLCTLLLGNVLVNSTLTILLDDLTSGVVAVVGSTVGIVIFGEIIPQAICSRFGLAIGAHTVWITKFFMLVTFPMSYPISLLLDKILGEELGAYYNRERLKELIKVTKEYHDLEKEEVNIIAGALELRRKTVGDIMTRLEDVFMLSYDAVLDFETVAEIMKQGFSRIPIYETERSNIVGLLFIKELALIDPEDAIPLKTLCRFYQNKCNFVFEDTTLDVIFKEFKEGQKGHMAFVQRINNKGDGDPFYETVGLVTLEDTIEELIQSEIIDETDVWLDNRSKRRREKGKPLQDLSYFAMQYPDQTAHKISPQLALAAFQFLTSTMEPFKPEYISETVLRRLMQQDLVIRSIRVKNASKTNPDPNTFIYQQGKAADYFVLILEGRVEVTIGKENLVFESGPFSHFGYQALTAVPTHSHPTIGESPSSIQLFRSVQAVQTPSSPDGGGFAALGIGGLGLGNGQTIPNGFPQALAVTGGNNLIAGGTKGPVFISDYTVRAVTDVVFFRLSRSLYQAAVSATQLERTQRDVAQRIAECECILEQTIEEVRETNHPPVSVRIDSIDERSSLIHDATITVPEINTMNVGHSLHDSLPNGFAKPSFVLGDNTDG